MFTDFFHRLFNPHCEECLLRDRERLEREAEERVCRHCEFMKNELAKEQERSRKLLDSILTFQDTSAKMMAKEAVPFPEPIPGAFKPWHVRQRELEEASRKEALKLKETWDKSKATSATTEELEQQLIGGTDESTS